MTVPDAEKGLLVKDAAGYFVGSLTTSLALETLPKSQKKHPARVMHPLSRGTPAWHHEKCLLHAKVASAYPHGTPCCLQGWKLRNSAIQSTLPAAMKAVCVVQLPMTLISMMCSAKALHTRRSLSMEDHLVVMLDLEVGKVFHHACIADLHQWHHTERFFWVVALPYMASHVQHDVQSYHPLSTPRLCLHASCCVCFYHNSF